METTYIINITNASNRTAFLYKAYAKHAWKTCLASKARAFKTAEAAQAFIDQHAINFDGKWEVVAYTPTVSK